MSSKKPTTKTTPKSKIKRNRKRTPRITEKNKTHDSEIKKQILKCKITLNLELSIIYNTKEKEKGTERRNNRESGIESLSYKFSLIPWVNHSAESVSSFRK